MSRSQQIARLATGVYSDNSGNVGVGTSSPISNANQISVSINASDIPRLDQLAGGSLKATIQFDNPNSIWLLKTIGANPIAFSTTNIERMRIDSSGNLLVGQSSLMTSATSNTVQILAAGSAQDPALNAQQIIASSNAYNATAQSGISFWNKYTSGGAYAGMGGISVAKENTTDGNYASYFAAYTRPNGGAVTERMRIDSSGNLLVNTSSTTVTAGSYAFQTSGYWQVYRNSSTSSDGIVDFYSNWSSTKNNIFRVDSRGNILIATGSTYGNFSDAAFKENIVDATPKLDDLMKIKVRNFTVKGDESGDVYLGYIAQEVETVFPKLVSEIETETGNKKAVKESVFVPMLIKAIQEQQAIIESMKADIEALKAA